MELSDHIEENPGLKSRITDTLPDTVYRSVVGGLSRDYPTARLPLSRQLSMEEVVCGGIG
ncbi:MAG: hypothetical protein LC126_24980 [Bryobacterales bacterium]|nr:hypothetical protein [Bryobacterales bacterium]